MKNTKKSLTLIIILSIVVLLAIVGGVYIYSHNKSQQTLMIQTAGWETFSVQPASGTEIRIKYPPTWSPTELSFKCKNPKDQILSVVSPVRADLSGYSNMPVAYLVQFCGLSLNYQGFIRTLLSHEPKESDKIVLENSALKNTDEYKVAQQIISSISSVSVGALLPG